MYILMIFCLLIVFSVGSYMPPGPPNGTHKPGLHPAGFPMARVPLPPFQGGPPSQPYAIPTRGAVHGPVGAVPHVPQPGSRGFGAGRGNAGAPIGSHLPHQQPSQQPVGAIGSTFNFPLENPNSQPSVGGPLTQPGFVNNVCTSQNDLNLFVILFVLLKSTTLLLCAVLSVFVLCGRCQSKGLVKHFVMDFLWEGCLRYLYLPCATNLSL